MDDVIEARMALARFTSDELEADYGVEPVVVRHAVEDDFGAMPTWVTSFLAHFGYKPNMPLPPGVTLNSDGTVTLPNGVTGKFDPKTGTVTTSDGQMVAAASPGITGVNQTVTSPSPPIDLSEWARAAKGTAIGGGVGVVLGGLLGFSVAGPIGAKVGAVAVGVLGGLLGYEIGPAL